MGRWRRSGHTAVRAPRKPDDLNAFCAKAIEEFAEGRHEGQRAATTM